jgi:hypothetical protein
MRIGQKNHVPPEQLQVWDNFNEFEAYLYDEVVEKDGHDSTEEVQITEIMHHMREWFKKT